MKNLPAVQETQVRSLGWEDPLEKGMAIHSSILAWRIPWTEESGRLQSIRLQRVRHELSDSHFHLPLCLVTQSFPTLCNPTRLLCPWGFSRQEYWSGLPHPPPGDIPNPGIEPGPPASQVNSLLSEPPGKHHFPTQRLINNFIECFSLWAC